MRAWILLALTGCSVDIASGAYLCGPEQLCPENLVCNGPDNRCVLPSVREDFRCELGTPPEDPSADDQASTGNMVPDLDCVSPSFERENCLDLGDSIDWYQIDTPAECNAVAIEARVEYPIAFQPVGLRFSDDGGMGTPMETECEDLSSVAGGTWSRASRSPSSRASATRSASSAWVSIARVAAPTTATCSTSG